MSLCRPCSPSEVAETVRVGVAGSSQPLPPVVTFAAVRPELEAISPLVFADTLGVLFGRM